MAVAEVLFDPRSLPGGEPAEPGPGLTTSEFRGRLVGMLPQLRKWALRLTDNGSEATDLVQETCRKALEAHAQFIKGDDLKPWLFRILRNLHVDQCRRVWRLVCLDNVDWLDRAAGGDKQPLWRSVSDEQMEGALARLPPLYRSVYVLRTVDGLSYGEIGQRLGVGLNTVGTRLIRARRMLRAWLVAEIESRA
jgi:RNA polymerase sigma-70 factor (ECF subfamily)